MVQLGPFDSSKKSHLGALIGIVSLLTLEITSMASPTMITVESSTQSNFKILIGSFRVSCTGEEGDGCTGEFKNHQVKCLEQNFPWVSFGTESAGTNTKCSEALVTKCQVSQAFLLVGFFAHLLSIGTPFVPVVANIAGNALGLALTLLSAISYLIVWSLWAYLRTHNRSTDRSDCGLKSITGVNNYKMGAAFACTVVATFVCIAQAVLFLLGRQDSSGGYGSGPTKKVKRAAKHTEMKSDIEMADDTAVPEGAEDDL